MAEFIEIAIRFFETHPIARWTGFGIIILGVGILLFVLIRRKRRKMVRSQKNITNELPHENGPAVVRQHKTKSTTIKQEQQTQIKEIAAQQQQTEKSNSIKVDVREEPTHKEIIINKLDIPHKVIPEPRPAEELPTPKIETGKEISQNLFVNYQLNTPESVNNYAIIRIPKKGCIVRSHRDGITKRRGFKEESFQSSIQQYFGSNFIISGAVRLNTGKETRPFEPDIAIIGNSIINIRIDIEIDEPYAGITRQPTHCKGDDMMRDAYFADRGWIVIRFSEYQVHTQEHACLKYIAKIINKIDDTFIFPTDLIPVTDLKPEKAWDIVQAQKWEKELYRETYLNHRFQATPEIKETIERDLNTQELNEEKLVKSSVIGEIDKKETIGFNKINAHPRDNRIKFYPEPHIYTIDNVPASSASTVISKFFPEFDAYGKACGLSPSNPLYGNSPEQIVQIWKQKGEEAANLGTYLHEQIEKYYLKQTFKETGEFHLFKQFVKDHSHIEPYRSEWRIFDDNHNIAGTIDLIAKNSNGFDIYDWKRSRKVIDTYAGCPITTDSWGNRGVGELYDIHDTSYNRYCLQQSLYRYILEKSYNLNISKMYLIILYPDYDKYYKVEVPYWKDRIEYILEAI